MFGTLNVPTSAPVYPHIAKPLFIRMGGEDWYFGKVIVSPRMGYFTKAFKSEFMANEAAKELIKKVEVKK